MNGYSQTPTRLDGLDLTAELNQVLPKDEKLFYKMLGRTTPVEHDELIDVSITNKDKSHQYVNMIAFSPRNGSNDKIRIMIPKPRKTLQVERPNGKGFNWLVKEIFPHLEASVQSWAKRNEQAETKLEEWPEDKT